MLGDLILRIIKILKQNFCIHHYKRHSIGCADYVWWECEKCGKVRYNPV